MALVAAVCILMGSDFVATAGEKAKLSPVVGKIELKDGKAEVKGKLAEGDPKDVGKTESYCKIYSIKLEAGKSYEITCRSALDNWLRIEDAKGKQLAEDDDSGGGTDAQIIFDCKADGEYRVIVTSFEPVETGDFVLTFSKK